MSFLSFLTLSNSSASHHPSESFESLTNDNGISKYSTVTLLSSVIFVLTLLTYSKDKILGSLKRKRELYKIPSPSLLTMIKDIYQLATTSDSLRTVTSLGRKYSAIYPKHFRLQIGPFYHVVVLNSPESIEKLLSSSEEGHLVKPDEYEPLADYFDEGLVTSCGEKWKARRKLFSPLFNYKCFPHFLEVFNKHSKYLVEELDQMFKGNDEAKPIQIPIYETALKIICETACGVGLGDSPKEFIEFFEEAEKSKAYIYRRTIRFWYRVNWIWKFHPFRSEYERNVKYIKDFILKVMVEARRRFTEALQKGPSDEVDQKFKTVMDVMLENEMSTPDIREEAHTVISAGHETSASVIQFTLMLLALHPEHQAKCQKEIDEIINDQSKCPNGDFSLSSVSDLKYTKMCLKETLRLYPVIYAYGRKIETPLRLDDSIVLPEGTTCVVSATSLHMNPKLYPEPEKFDPSRFTPENSAARHPFAYIPFSRGPRICLGYRYATTQIALMLARILHHFSVSTTEKIEDVPCEASMLLAPVRGYNFKLKSRNPILHSN